MDIQNAVVFEHMFKHTQRLKTINMNCNCLIISLLNRVLGLVKDFLNDEFRIHDLRILKSRWNSKVRIGRILVQAAAAAHF